MVEINYIEKDTCKSKFMYKKLGLCNTNLNKADAILATTMFYSDMQNIELMLEEDELKNKEITSVKPLHVCEVQCGKDLY